MASRLRLLVAFVLVAAGVAQNPLSKVIELLDSLAAKVKKDGEAEDKAFHEYKEWCDDAAKNAQFAVDDATKEKATLEAKISELSSDVEVATAKIEKLASSGSEAETELKKAAALRKKEAATFLASEKELEDTIDTLTRALQVLNKEASKGAAALAQVATSNQAAVLAALSTILDAAAFPSSDTHRLQALLQAQQQSAQDADEPPTAPAYSSHSGGIIELIEDLKDKAEAELSDLRKAEVTAKHNFELLRQSLETSKDQAGKDLSAEKQNKAEAEEDKANAEGELEKTVASLKNSQEELASTQAVCMRTAADHEATVAGRQEELKVIADAKEALSSTSGAESKTYSLVQLESTSRARTQVVNIVRRLAKKHHSAALAQLSSRIAAMAKYGGSNGEDVFGKIKGMIQSMIAKLEKEASEEATEKAYCDAELAKTEAKHSDLSDDIEKLVAKIDTSVARSAHLKEEVSVLQEELAALSKEQAEMDQIRQESHASYVASKADLEEGLVGVRKALTVLRDYYGSSSAALVQDGALGSFMQQPAAPEQHSKASGAGTGIIGLLEVVESDMAKELATEESEEADSESSYQKATQENKVTKATKTQDEKYKSQEIKSLDKSVTELSADRQSSNSELSAVLDYDAKLKERCIAKPETFEERAARRQAEIEGLKSALRTLEEETAFVQHGHSRRHHGHRGAFLAPR